jgi:hypothetical protein
VLRLLIQGGPADGLWWPFVRGVADERIGRTASDLGKQAPDETRDHVGAERARGQLDGPRRDPVDERERDRWIQLRDKLVRVEPAFPDAPLGPFVDWASAVARFSFESSRVLVGQRSAERPAVDAGSTGVQPGSTANVLGDTASATEA